MKTNLAPTTRLPAFRRFHPFAALLAAVTLAAPVLHGGELMVLGQPQRPTDEKAILALEEESRLAVLHHDFATLERIWAERFVVNAPLNSVLPNRAAVFELFRRGVGVYSSHEKSVECIVFDGDDAIVMGGETVVPRHAPAGSQPVPRRYTNVWRFENGRWQLIARQSTMIAPGAPSGPPSPPNT